MSSSIYQGLQSCLEPRVAEPRILKLKLAHPKSSPTHSLETSNKVEAKNEMIGLNSIQNIITKKPIEKASQETQEKVYVHPLIKRSASFLSERSLEMCTESLGSETGSGISETIIADEIETTSFALENNVFSRKDETKMRKFGSRRKRNLIRSSSFPPPLKSMRNSIHVKPHREGGRLVLEAVSISPRNVFFHAERSHGRLRLRFLKSNSDDEGSQGTDIEEDDYKVSEIEDVEEVEVDDHEEDECDDDGSGFRDMDGNSEDGEVGNGMGEELSRPTRCKESERTKKAGLWDLEPYWVAST